jgi:uncharacterized protein (DUF952 family)
MTEIIYKIVRAEDWNIAKTEGVFTGSSDDRRDGYLHFSSAHQLRATYSKYYATEERNMLVIVEVDVLGNGLKWEVSRGGEKFPHFYGVLRVSDVCAAVPIAVGPDGQPRFPPEIP